jgi:anthranilate synthase component 2
LIAIIDNYDSFTYNLVQYFGELGARVQVFRNDTISVGQLQALEPSHIVISPGPGDPSEAGISNQVIRELGTHTPLLGVCLGHQCIGEVFGGRVVGAGRLMHGKTSQVHHYGEGLFSGIPSPFEATRYHSLIVRGPDPAELAVTAFTTRQEVMALRHRRYPIYGVQFHPEAILTQYGKQILKNFLLVNHVGRASVPVQVKGESHA